MFITSAFAPAALAAEPLRPDELLLVYNRDDPRSRELAEYYAAKRGVPAGRLCSVRANRSDEEMDRPGYERYIRRPVREYLESHQLRDKVRCLVTFYGLPLRVGPKAVSPAEQRLAASWRQEFLAALGELQQAVDQLEATVTGTASRPSSQPLKEADYARLLAEYRRARAAAWQQVLAGRQRGEANEGEYQTVLASLQANEGWAGVINRLQPQENAPAVAAQQLDQLVRQVRQADDQIAQLEAKRLADPSRQEARRLIRQNHGLIGLLVSLDLDLAGTRAEETQAALDSELMLLWWDDYPLYRWVPNTMNWRMRADAGLGLRVPDRHWRLPVLMTSRIDGPSVRVAQRLIDDAMAAEREGTMGSVYLDARGMKPGDGGGTYDQNIRDLAAIVWKETSLTVRLDNRSAVFGPGSCPETAMLYCGWYSLRKYVDAFTFVRGAVGYHIASFEAVSLKQPGEAGWCKGLLDHGVAATLGPVAEPYLESFPRPTEFFGLLLTGKLTLAECYAGTLPLNSWMQTLIGDPLYRPFAKRPYLTVEQVFPPELIPPEFRSSPASQAQLNRAPP